MTPRRTQRQEPPLVSLYFQVHQPYRLRDLRITELGALPATYFDAERNASIFRKVAEKCYLPTTHLLQELLEHYPDFSVSFSLSGVFLDQCEEYGPDVLQAFQALTKTGKVEMLAETSHHSLAALASLPEFCAQIRHHVDRMEALFGQRPRVFRNTELLYSNEIAHLARLLGFRGILAEGADHLLQGRTANIPYRPPSFRLPPTTEEVCRQYRVHDRPSAIAVLLKHYRLSDDVAFRFSDRSWVGFPLTAETFVEWVLRSGGHCVNLYMDFETFGEHQWADTGILEFLAALPRFLQDRGLRAVTPSDVIAAWGTRPKDVYDAHRPISWADTERDLSAWRGNHLQEAAFASLYALEGAVMECEDATVLQDWRRLQTSDHFYYMCTKYWADGDVHAYFNPYDSPYEAYRRYSHALWDLRSRLGHPSLSASLPAHA